MSFCCARPPANPDRSPLKPEGSLSATSITEQSESVSEESKPEVINMQKELTDEGSDEDTDWDSALRYDFQIMFSPPPP